MYSIILGLVNVIRIPLQDGFSLAKAPQVGPVD